MPSVQGDSLEVLCPSLNYSCRSVWNQLACWMQLERGLAELPLEPPLTCQEGLMGGIQSSNGGFVIKPLACNFSLAPSLFFLLPRWLENSDVQFTLCIRSVESKLERGMCGSRLFLSHSNVCSSGLLVAIVIILTLFSKVKFPFECLGS